MTVNTDVSRGEEVRCTSKIVVQKPHWTWQICPGRSNSWLSVVMLAIFCHRERKKEIMCTMNDRVCVYIDREIGFANH